MKSKLYYETHVTIDSTDLTEDRVEELFSIAKEVDFRVSKFIMLKSPDAPDAFISGRAEDYMEAVVALRKVIFILQKNFFKIKRYKIEDVIIDSNKDDYFKLL